ncbi:YD repeat-containing protein [Desulfatibacillum alkenivorans DSM 16219]|jgi:YD repeat-containing protein|uniref:YD repeat-containing protein n=1 Tax=Desulfatibacillum alkenivorans DSM 16219 TaxID=1121393 RepID=A0A1M6MX11_9BACT|nr:RHS repeat domain-containing protein [Desulfatibacillum alkenivorans]SHJ87930.1 YD repeat-containing protein [Desulfatibacillum alkenivorans DSM 16219]
MAQPDLPTLAYDSYGYLESLLHEDGNGKYYEYDYFFDTKEYYSKVTTSMGKVTETWFDEHGNTTRMEINGQLSREIVKEGRIVRVTDGAGKTTVKEYDEWENLIQVTYPDQTSVSYEYDSRFNKKTKAVNELGVVMEFE